ncbi:hypothetical protein LOK49_LG07G00188 [Camellia lanceoleosa]|uniref:Uncharacterized protein n=1 Tax=Camellia lanceoleosa TaxID=1840588 RepID=A0ACC0H112_9ERIC|nr:hypothetical protein LOK49_LG07G00188 [Camellia lanceoleosa]
MQAIHIVGGFRCVLKMKDEEVEKLKKENMELRKQIVVLEDQLADRNVHDVTQAFRTMEVDCKVRGVGTGSSEFGGEGLSDVTPLCAVGMCVNNCGESDLNLGTDDMMVQVHGPYNLNMYDSKTEVVPQVLQAPPGFGVQKSYVCNIKNKVRKQWKMHEFEYPLLAGRGTRMGSIVGNVGGEDIGVVRDDIINMDTVILHGNKWSKFGINNRLGVWKMMTVEEKAKITTAYERHEDEVVMWGDSTNGVSVYFTDVKALVRQSSICGNVIDAYAELLKTEQHIMYANDKTTDKSYFFSSIFLKE